MGQVQYQSRLDRTKVRNFFIKYQDRLMYATDLTHQDGGESEDIASEAHTKWYSEWLYLTGDQVMSAPEVEGEFPGLKLPASVIDKIYYSNAKALLRASCAAGPNEKGCIL
jgi:predicted TIM-barrel fold metal-dependent hydrolase